MTLRRPLLAVALLGAGGGASALLGGACMTFAFSAPTLEAGAEAGAPPGFLGLTAAGQLCALVFECPGLAEAIEGSLVVPVGTPSSPLNFSGCMDWLAGPVDPARPGLALQQRILAQIAAAQGCSAAYSAAPVHPAATPDPCVAS